MKEKVIIHKGYPALIESNKNSISVLISLKKAQDLQLGKVPKSSVDNGSLSLSIKKS